MKAIALHYFYIVRQYLCNLVVRLDDWWGELYPRSIFNMRAARGHYLDSMCSLLGVERCVYGDDVTNRPNDYCFWGTAQGYCWMETDEHLRVRAIAILKNVGDKR